jgi:hypothetical protein
MMFAIVTLINSPEEQKILTERQSMNRKADTKYIFVYDRQYHVERKAEYVRLRANLRFAVLNVSFDRH